MFLCCQEKDISMSSQPTSPDRWTSSCLSSNSTEPWVWRPPSPASLPSVSEMLGIFMSARWEVLGQQAQSVSQCVVLSLSPLQVTEVELLYEFLKSLLWRDNIPAVVESGAQDYLLVHQLKQTESWEKNISKNYLEVIETHPALDVEDEGECGVTEAGIGRLPRSQWGHPAGSAHCRRAGVGWGSGLTFRLGDDLLEFYLI